MLKLINIKKDYIIDNKAYTALDNINIEFRDKEFVSILGPSGCGKTTLLNIIGGLDEYTSGRLIIDNISTNEYNDQDWDSYRNHRIGFVFQNYNLISHLSVLDNVELSLTLAGTSKQERMNKSIDILNKVGLKEHLHKLPNQLSGGQMQRVSIARALINEPSIILADEPTGALDSKTSVEIMEILKEISKEKLIIMVTHNQDLAKKYSSRIVSLLDGKIVNDNNIVEIEESQYTNEKPKKISMSFLTALKLSLKNLLTKKTRTLLTAFAGSIGIIGIALSLSLKSGFNTYLNEMNEEKFDTVPLMISKKSYNIATIMGGASTDKIKEAIGVYDDDDIVYLNDLEDISYINSLETLVKPRAAEIMYLHSYNSSFVYKEFDKVYKSSYDSSKLINNDYVKQSYLSDYKNSKLFNTLASIESNHKYQAYICVNNEGRVPIDLLKFLGFRNVDKNTVIKYDQILGKTFKYYTSDNFDNKTDSELLSMYDSNDFEIQITSVVAPSSQFLDFEPVIYYNNETKNRILENVDEKLNQIFIYPKNYENKQELINLLNQINIDRLSSGQRELKYVDQVSIVTDMAKTLTNSMSTILIAFSGISLFVSSILIGIITYTSVLERTKEIGILRSLGARKKDVSRVFNAEGIMIGFISGIFGVITTLIINPFVSMALEGILETKNVSRLLLLDGISLIFISVFLTLVAGYIPSKIASNKNPVVALRTDN